MMEPGFYNMDCMEAMKQFPDGFFDLAVVDPPYGDGNSDCGGGGGSGRCSTDTKQWNRFGQRFDRYKDLGQIRRMYDLQKVCGGGNRLRAGGQWATRYKKIIAWDVAPEQAYFEELFRISRNQIIWGGNYFNLPPTRCFLIWRKLSISESFSMAMAEYAWTSFKSNAKVFEYAPQGTNKEQRFHPTQKPIALYSWLLGLYAKPGDKILDTHVGSASSLIACHRAGLQYWGFEIDSVYYQKAVERLEKEKNQVSLFEPAKEERIEQIGLL